MDARPSPQDYTDYRSYLADIVAHLKATSRSFSYRAFARRGGIASSGFLKHVIDGERKLTPAATREGGKGSQSLP